MEEANLSGVYLGGVDLEGANLEKADLQEAWLEGANLFGVILPTNYSNELWTSLDAPEQEDEPSPALEQSKPSTNA